MSVVYDMFGKSVAELTPDEKRKYDRANKRKQRRKRAAYRASYRNYRSGILEDNFGKMFIDELTDDEFDKLYNEV